MSQTNNNPPANLGYDPELTTDQLHAQWRAKYEQVQELWNLDKCQKNDRIEELEDAIRWALGEHGDGFSERGPNDGKYWWRRELRQRAGVIPENS
jgi:hypothetical protein